MGAVMDSGEFSVCRFNDDGTYEYVRRGVDAREAVETAKVYTSNPAALLGITKRVIITDGGDCTNFEWRFGEGVVYPPSDGTRFVAHAGGAS
jgi:hypothetical protein